MSHVRCLPSPFCQWQLVSAHQVQRGVRGKRDSLQDLLLSLMELMSSGGKKTHKQLFLTQGSMYKVMEQ